MILLLFENVLLFFLKFWKMECSESRQCRHWTPLNLKLRRLGPKFKRLTRLLCTNTAAHGFLWIIFIGNKLFLLSWKWGDFLWVHILLRPSLTHRMCVHVTLWCSQGSVSSRFKNAVRFINVKTGRDSRRFAVRTPHCAPNKKEKQRAISCVFLQKYLHYVACGVKHQALLVVTLRGRVCWC